MEKATDKEERVRLLREYGEEQGRLALGSGRGRGNARGGGKGAGGHGNVQGAGTANAPTAAVVSGAAMEDEAAGSQIARPMAEKMTPKDQEICNKHNICKWHAVYGGCKFGPSCRSLHLSAAERKTKGLSFVVSSDKEDLSSRRSENGIVVDLFNGCCDLADAERIIAEPTAHGEAFHGQFGAFGFFALDADDMHIALDADEMPIALDVVNVPIALDADNMLIGLEPSRFRHHASGIRDA